MIRPKDLPAVAAALRSADYRFLGVRPVTAQQMTDAPCVLLAEHTLRALDLALKEALAMWPEAEAWQLLGSDLESVRNAQTDANETKRQPKAAMTPRGRQLRRPIELVTFQIA